MVYKIVSNDKATRLNDAFNQGQAAAKSGVTIGMCPYSGWKQVEERKRWIEGFEFIRSKSL